MLIVFPQFIRRDGWPIAVQALLLGGLVLAIAVPVYSGLALAAARAARGLLARPGAILLVHRGAGILLGGIGLTLAAAQADFFTP
jgi:threonine/homoserine/homoserine lactone efflux protein